MGRLIERIKNFVIKVSKFTPSLKSKMFINAFLVLLLFVAGFELFAYINLRNYNYNNLRNLMYSQARYSTELYVSYVADSTLNENILLEKRQFIGNAEGQIQVLDLNGVVLYDNIASRNIGKAINNVDVILALESNGGSNVYKDEATGEKILAISVPLNDRTSQVGVMRVLASLDQVDAEILRQFTIFIAFGIASVMIGALVSYYSSKQIFKPINKLTEVAKKYSDGQYEAKSNIPYDGEIGELAMTMDNMSENIIEKEAIKTEFISSVSHELRTPLTSIKGWSITLQDDGIDKDITLEGLQIIEKESDRLSDMVEDLLDFSRFMSPKFKLSKSTFNIVDIAQSIVTQLRPRVKDKKINLLLNYETDYVEVIADENRIKQVFINLLDNSIKFTPIEGTVAVNIQDRDNEVLVDVIDTGIGITADEIDKVTMKFYKGMSSESHTGLGLSICEEIVKAHNGKLMISSVEGEGTTISFTIPKKVIE